MMPPNDPSMVLLGDTFGAKEFGQFGDRLNRQRYRPK